MDNTNEVQTEIQYWYTTKDVLAALKARGLPSTWAQVKLYRDVKLIPPLRNIVKFHRKDSPVQEGTRVGTVISKKDHPIFTQQDIDTIVEAVAKVKADEEVARLLVEE